MTILRVISGGQTGVDIAALRAAKSLGIPTGGWMPRGWRTLTGPRPEYAELYGMRETDSDGYRVRTFANVQYADMTLRIASDFGSAGERCTERALKLHQRQYVDIRLRSSKGRYVGSKAELAAAIEFIRRTSPRVLNIAGNSEKTAPGIEAAAERAVKMVLEWVMK